MKISLQQVRGSGPGGRITRRDIEGFLAAPAKAPAPAAPATPPAAPAAAPAKTPPAKTAAPLPPLAPLAAAPTPADETIPLNRLRGAIGRRMVESKQQAPHFYVTHEYDMGPLMELRKQVNAMLPDEEKISVNDFLVKAAALTLRQFPNLNAAFQGDKVVRYGAIHIGIAVAVENGLLTVVVREADRKPLRQIALEAKKMAGRAREGKVKPEDIEGSTFSTSNLGMYDVEHFIAIINPPEAGILAIGSAREVPVVKDGQLAVGWRMKATLSVDHRVSDGAEGARFMQALKEYIETPLRLMV
jgi:pyruvate dehydrogenase E2 component (dihydrolipoamide acetyltransferase)